MTTATAIKCVGCGKDFEVWHHWFDEEGIHQKPLCYSCNNSIPNDPSIPWAEKLEWLRTRRCRCLRCAYEWIPYFGNASPKCCPVCKSYMWNKPYKRGRPVYA